MPLTSRSMTTDDIPQVVDLLLLDAEERRAKDPVLWKVAEDARARIEAALVFALTAMNQPIRQFWQVACDQGRISGVIHSMLLPVPPIYAGAKGEPGLILADTCISGNAPDGTAEALVDAAETALRGAGARIILASFVTGETWREGLARRGYQPLTLYLSHNDFGGQPAPVDVRPAREADIPGIVSRSAKHRRMLFNIDPFWETHPDADPRFASWMARSLTFCDRDMLVSAPDDGLNGYVIAQPATQMHFPPAHEIEGTGVIDDFYHPDFAHPTAIDAGGRGATAMLRAAEAAFARRGKAAAFMADKFVFPGGAVDD
ncbi:MAG: hypothetical protein AAFY03_07840, partial [Pseudomonadota bacterium]